MFLLGEKKLRLRRKIEKYKKKYSFLKYPDESTKSYTQDQKKISWKSKQLRRIKGWTIPVFLLRCQNS